jgi:hypothetical protein
MTAALFAAYVGLADTGRFHGDVVHAYGVQPAAYSIPFAMLGWLAHATVTPADGVALGAGETCGDALGDGEPWLATLGAEALGEGDGEACTGACCSTPTVAGVAGWLLPPPPPHPAKMHNITSAKQRSLQYRI